MGASVRIEDDAFSDLRYYRLAVRLDLVAVAAARGLDPADLARGVMAPLWRQCTIEDTYFLPPEDVNRVLGPAGVDAIIDAKLGELRADGFVRIRGTRGRVEWLEKKRKDGRRHGRKGAEFGKLGGRPRKPPSEPGKGVSENPPPAPAPAPAPALDPDIAASPPPLTLSAEQPTSSKRKRAATTLPPGWKPNGNHQALAREQRVDLNREAAKFTDWAAAKDQRYASWDAAFSNWLRNARSYGAPALAPPADDAERFTTLAPRPARNGGAQP